MKYTQIPATAFKNIQLNAGVLVTGFTPATGEFTGLLGATTGGVQFNAAPTYTDFGDDIDNCPKNTLELKKLESWEVTMSGTFVTVSADTAKRLIASASVDANDSTHIIPRNDVNKDTDFQDIWWIGDYSDENDGSNAGYCAVHMMNALNTGGFQIQSTDKGKGNFAFTFTGHYSMNAQDTVPFEVYIKGSDSALIPSIEINSKYIQVTAAAGSHHTHVLSAVTVPEGQTITWSVDDDEKATITQGSDTAHKTCTVTGVAAGSTIVTATITKDDITYSDTCTVVVTAG